MSFVAVPGGYAGAAWTRPATDSFSPAFECLGLTAVGLDGTTSGATLLRLMTVLPLPAKMQVGLVVAGRGDGSSGQGQAWYRWDLAAGDASLALLGALHNESGLSTVGGGLTLRGQLGCWAVETGIGTVPTGHRPTLQAVIGYRRAMDRGEVRHEAWTRRVGPESRWHAGGRTGLFWQLGPGPTIGLSVGAGVPVDAPAIWLLEPALALTW